jgi:hypothetical protein
VEVVVFGRVAASGRRWCVLALVLVLALGACGGDGKPDDATPTTQRSSTTTSTSSTSTTSAPDDTAVRSAYEAANRAFIDAAAIPDPDFPAIAATHSGPMLEQRRDVLRALRADGRVIRYPADSKYRIVIESVETDGDVSRLQFCAVDDGQRVDSKTGEVISEGVVTARGEAALRLEAGVWKLAEQKFDSRTEGASCA